MGKCSVLSRPPSQCLRRRPKGGKNRNKADVVLSPYLSFILTLLQAVKQMLGTTLAVTYVVLDGAFGNNYALQMVRRCQLQLISKLAVNSALFFLYDGPYSGRGPHKKYGERVKYGALPGKYLKQTTTEKGICTESYQFNALHKLFAQTLNVVFIVKTNTETGVRAHASLFSSDLNQTKPMTRSSTTTPCASKSRISVCCLPMISRKRVPKP